MKWKTPNDQMVFIIILLVSIRGQNDGYAEMNSRGYIFSDLLKKMSSHHRIPT